MLINSKVERGVTDGMPVVLNITWHTETTKSPSSFESTVSQPYILNIEALPLAALKVLSTVISRDSIDNGVLFRSRPL